RRRNEAELDQLIGEGVAITGQMRAHQAAPVTQHLRRKVFDTTEIEEDDATVAVEQVVAGVGVAVEDAVAQDGAEDEAEDDLAVAGAGGLVELADGGEVAPLDELGGEDAPARVAVDDARDANEGVAVVDAQEAALVVGLAGVVELLAD